MVIYLNYAEYATEVDVFYRNLFEECICVWFIKPYSRNSMSYRGVFTKFDDLNKPCFLSGFMIKAIMKGSMLEEGLSILQMNLVQPLVITPNKCARYRI